MELIINETITQQYGVDAENDADALKALDEGKVTPIIGSRNVNRRVVIRPTTQQTTNINQARMTIPT